MYVETINRIDGEDEQVPLEQEPEAPQGDEPDGNAA
jgi:hypothetical protein